jgi:uncharacterized protein YbcC (UPF0753/DUF2309 family)
MNHTLPQVAVDHSANLDIAIAEALDRVAPLWPLEHFVAVNPFMGLVGRTFADASGVLRRTLGKAPVQLPEEYLASWREGRITPEDLALVSDEGWTKDRLLEILRSQSDQPLHHPVMSFADLLDDTLPHAHWSDFIAEEIAKWCAVHYDRNQTTWNSPWREMGLFAAWKSAACYDRKPEMFGLAGFCAYVRKLPDDVREVIEQCMLQLDPRGVDATDFLHRQLSNISGWAGHVRYLVREDEMRGRKNSSLLELLAIRLAYDAALHASQIADSQIAATWRSQRVSAETTELDEALARWQSAYEAGYQRKLAAALIGANRSVKADRPEVQAVFCIDVRSEIVRRHLESVMPGAQTLGFAGFFGFPLSHQKAHACRPASRCPVLLVPPLRSSEPRPVNADRAIAESGAWKAFQNSATSCFSFVESLGVAFVADLLKPRGNNLLDHESKPRLDEHDVGQLAAVAEGALRGMSLTSNFARLVLICGHGSHSANNPFASSLDCGACGGHGGEVNARIAADAFNHPGVRHLLKKRGILIPDDTHFVASRHDTLSDDFVLFDKENVPVSHLDTLASLETALSRVGEQARRERASRLGLDHVRDDKLAEMIRRRGNDIAEVRPEWALANNAALIAAPRWRTAGLPLDGRIFLHEYDPTLDSESEVLKAILTAPVVVASWINLQYYASRIDPEHFAAGDKTIHHVVAGLGVIEGNAGDLRSGLPMQSIHDGKDFVHEPRRLTVYLEGETELVDKVLEQHPDVRQLFDHQWIHLFVLTGGCAYQRRNGSWNVLHQ